MAYPELVQQALDTLNTDDDRALFTAAYDEAYSQTQDTHKAYLAGWGAVRKDSLMQRLGLKSADNERPIVAGWGMLFTDAENPDLDQQFFDENTKLGLEFYRNAPLFWEHGNDPQYGVDPIGQRYNVTVYPRGLWVEHTLFPEHPRFEQTLSAVKSGLVSYSSDSMAHYVREGIDTETGRLGVWWLSGWSLVSSPAEPSLGVVTMKEFAHAVKSARTREASADTAPQQPKKTQPTGETNMSMLKNIAAFLGVEEKYDAVLPAFKSAMEDMQKMSGDEDMDTEEIDGAASTEGKAQSVAEIAAALGLEEGATVDMILARMAEIEAMLKQEASATYNGNSTAKSWNLNALKSATELAAKSAPAKKQELPIVSNGNNGAHKSTNRYQFNIGGRAEKPTLTAMVNDLRAGKAQNYNIGPLGGYVVREEVRQELLPQLRAQLVMQKLGVTITDMPDFASIDIPKMTASPDAYWVGTNQEIPEDEAQYQTIKLVPKQIAARTRIPLRMLQTMSAQAESRVRDEILRSLRLKIDYAMLYGAGAVTGSNNGSEPLGLINISAVNKQTIATNGRKPTPKDMSDMKARVEADNVELDDSTHWLYHPNILNYFEDLTDTTGQLINRAQWTKGYEPVTTTQIPTNNTTGTSTDTSDIFFGRWNYLEMGMGNNIELIVLNELYAANLQVGIIAHTYADMVVHYPEAFEVLRGVRTV